jgi:hypothetical protein
MVAIKPLRHSATPPLQPLSVLLLSVLVAKIQLANIQRVCECPSCRDSETSKLGEKLNDGVGCAKYGLKAVGRLWSSP